MAKHVDLSGQRFGKLVVIRYLGKSKWLCQCDCGNTSAPRTDALKEGKSMSCGCMGQTGLELGRQQTYNLTGKTFGWLTALYLEDGMWVCRCKCGRLYRAGATQLRKGQLKSCGCRPKDNPFLDLTGQRFGRLVALEHVRNNKHSSRIWKCQCDCGNTIETQAYALRSGHTKSCGCYHKDAITVHGMSYTREYKIFVGRKYAEAKKELDSEWTVDLEAALRKMFPYCVVCGITEEEHQKKYGRSLHVDHIKPLSKGHGLAIDNATVLCQHCNCTKQDKLLKDLPKEFRVAIKRASEQFVGRAHNG